MELVGLTGVHSLITRMSDHDRERALHHTKRVYCGRMRACEHGRQMRFRMGRQRAEMAIDKHMEYFDSAMMGIRGHDCHNMYRGCMDFQ
ncbi:uncharacterized protein LOC119381426 [Rhipicephalus sanguineus]|uniref:uncharacterized protein LOC119381426 n=1 Tax=Rhipicephalus sanguineus TaxID=34632 RepID=UPI0020C497A1|nr:uncharacterized protein LOC119381426 [Rhipicephalus sanguineus]